MGVRGEGNDAISGEVAVVHGRESRVYLQTVITLISLPVSDTVIDSWCIYSWLECQPKLPKGVMKTHNHSHGVMDIIDCGAREVDPGTDTRKAPVKRIPNNRSVLLGMTVNS